MFEMLFERSADAIILYDPQAGVFVDCNPAAVALLRADSREQLLNARSSDLSPSLQPDGRLSREAEDEVTAVVQENGSHRFEWLARRFDGTEVPLECLATAVPVDGGTLHVVVPRDISERKEAEEEVCLLTQTLEQRVVEATADLRASEAKFRTLVEHATEAIVVFDGRSGRFEMVNENAVRLFGRTQAELLRLTPADVSPPRQPDGRSSMEAAREMMEAALRGETPVFEWLHSHADGRVFASEVRLVRLPGERCCLLRATIVDHSERKRREEVQQATYEISEAMHSAEDLRDLYQRIHTIIGGLMPAKNFYLALWDEATELVTFPYFVDEFEAAPSPFELGTGLTSHVLRTGKSLLLGPEMNARKRRVGDEVTYRDFPELRYAEWGREAAIWLGVPLLVGGRPFGVMAVQDYQDGNAYGEEEKQILTFVAEQTASAIERKRAEQALHHRAEQMRRHRIVLLDLAQLDKSDFDRSISAICSRAAETFNLSRVGYWSLSDDDLALGCEHQFVTEKPGGDPAAPGLRLEAGECPSYFAALARKEPIVAHDALRHPATAELTDSYLRPLGIASMLDVPVWLHGKVVGVLCHEHVGEPREWTAEEIDFGGSLATMVALSIEAAQRARSEKALRESEQKFRALFEATSTGVMIHDELQFLEVNDAAVKMLGYRSAEDLAGKNPIEISPPFQPGGIPTAELAVQHIAECFSQGTARFEWVTRKENGVDLPVEVILTRIDMGGRQLIQAVVNDISARKEVEEELRESAARLRESEARFSAAFHASPVFSAIAQMGGGPYVEANDAFINWTGYSREEVMGRSSADLNLWVDPATRADFLEEFNERGLVRNREVEVRKRGGSVHTVLLSAQRISINGQPHMLTVALDISDRKRAEVEVWRALERERELSQLKNNFVSMVSHEFRTPLGIILSSAQILSDYFEGLAPEERREHLDAIVGHAKHMGGLMEEVLLLSRAESGGLVCGPVPLDFEAFARRVTGEIQSATERRCPIEFRAETSCREARADERLLHHIFTNLLTNAVKYSAAGSPVDFEVRRDGQEAVCLIRDHGIGIPDPDLERLFSPFQRGGNVGQVAGSGLGLVIVKRCAELHGGSVQVESQLNEGTTVTVRLPILRPE